MLVAPRAGDLAGARLQAPNEGGACSRRRSTRRSPASTICLFRFLGLGAASEHREELPRSTPRALDDAQRRLLLQAAAESTPRERAIVAPLLCTGLSEAAALRVADVRSSARKALVVVRSVRLMQTARSSSRCLCARCSTSGSPSARRSPGRRNELLRVTDGGWPGGRAGRRTRRRSRPAPGRRGSRAFGRRPAGGRPLLPSLGQALRRNRFVWIANCRQPHLRSNAKERCPMGWDDGIYRVARRFSQRQRGCAGERGKMWQQ